MLKLKDGYGALVGTAYKGPGSSNYLLKADGGVWEVNSGRNSGANKIVRTDASGYIQAGWINTTSGDMGNTAINKIYCSNDGYIRYKTPANFFSTLANDSNLLSITVGSQNRKLTVAYAIKAGSAGNADTVDNCHAIDFARAKYGFCSDKDNGYTTDSLSTWIANLSKFGGIKGNASITVGNWWWVRELKLTSSVGNISTSGGMVIFGGSNDSDLNYKHLLVLDAYANLYGITSNETSWKYYSRFAKFSEIPTKLSQLTNDKGYITGYTNNYLTGVTGTCGGTITFTRLGLGALTWNSSHNHGLFHSNFTCNVSSDTDNGWKTIDPNYVNYGYFLKSIRTEAKAPFWLLNNYSAGIAFGGGDTKAVMSCSYYAPNIRFAGGNGESTPKWTMTISGSSGKTYNLASFVTGGPYLPLSGGTLTGSLTISTGADTKLVINNTDKETYWSLISFRDNGTQYGWLGTNGSKDLKWTGYKIWHSGNLDPSKYLTSHLSLSNYVTLNTTQTISGSKTFSSSIKSSYASGSWINSVTNGALNCTYTSYGGIFNAAVYGGRIAMSTYPGSKDNTNVYLGYAETGRTSNSFAVETHWNGVSGIWYANGFKKKDGTSVSYEGHTHNCYASTDLYDGAYYVGLSWLGENTDANTSYIGAWRTETLNGATKYILHAMSKASLKTWLNINGDIAGKYLPLTGGTMSGLIVMSTGSTSKGIKIQDGVITSCSGELGWLSDKPFRFGKKVWDFSQWAGLTYDHSVKTVYLGIADGTIFTANTNQSGGLLKLPGITEIYTGTSGRFGADGTYGTWLQYGDAYINVKSDGLYWKNNSKFSIDGHTHTNITDGSMAVYSQYSNEVNFGGTNASSTIYFGYRATGSKPIPTLFIFGGSTGTSTLVAAKFKGSVTNIVTEVGASDAYRPVFYAYAGDNTRVVYNTNFQYNPAISYLKLGSILTSNWFRSTGNTGWYSETHGGGWYMIDSTWVRTYNSKKVYTASAEDNAFYTAGGMTATKYMTAQGFKKSGSSDAYVLLGAGGHKAESSLSVSYASSAGGATKLWSIDNRSSNTLPNSISSGLYADFKSNSTDGLNNGGTYHGVLTFRPYGGVTDFSGGGIHQLGFTENLNIYYRHNSGESSWGSWKRIAWASEIPSVSGYLPLAGGAMNSGARISASGGALYLGNSNNASWVYLADTCSQSGSTYWHIYHSGEAKFKKVSLNGSNHWSSDASDNIYANVGGATSLVVTSSSIRRGVSYPNVDLGSSTYPWRNIYGTLLGSSTSVLDCGDSRVLTFAYSKAGLPVASTSWLAAWNGNELRAISKNDLLGAYLPLSGGSMNSGAKLSIASVADTSSDYSGGLVIRELNYAGVLGANNAKGPSITFLWNGQWGGRLALCNNGTLDWRYGFKVGGVITSESDIVAYSDRRLKSNIQPLENRGFIQPVTYIKDGKESLGFIAQDMLELYPELVIEDTKSEEHYLAINYGQYTAVLQSLIINLYKLIDLLKEQLKSLQNGCN